MMPERDPHNKITGSPKPGEPAFLAVGKLRRPHGVKGEIIMDVLTDFPERLQVGVLLYAGESYLPLRIRSVRPHDKVLLMAFEGLHTPETVGEHRNQIVYVPAADRPLLPEGEYYHHQLIGLRVIDDTGQFLGVITGILETGGANDVYLVTSQENRELLLPDIEEVVMSIDLNSGEMQVHLLPGLLPDK
jgi:16S rRNA processing protein RimM